LTIVYEQNQQGEKVHKRRFLIFLSPRRGNIDELDKLRWVYLVKYSYLSDICFSKTLLILGSSIILAIINERSYCSDNKAKTKRRACVHTELTVELQYQ